MIPVRTQGQQIGASFYNDTVPNPSQFPTQMKQELNFLAESNTGAGSVAFGQSFAGSQTKAEIQTLQQNTNQILSLVADNYMRGQKEYWEAHYRAYALYMAKTDKKRISLFDSGKAFARTLRKSDFVTDGGIQVYVTSKSQQDAKNEKSFAKLVSIANLYLGNMKPGYAMNSFLRTIGTKLGIEGFDAYQYVPETPEETQARMNLELLNRDELPTMPEPGEDLQTYIDIYKQAVDTPAKQRALSELHTLYVSIRAAEPQAMGETDASSASMAMNMVTSDLANQMPSTQDVALS